PPSGWFGVPAGRDRDRPAQPDGLIAGELPATVGVRAHQPGAFRAGNVPPPADTRLLSLYGQAPTTNSRPPPARASCRQNPTRTVAPNASNCAPRLWHSCKLRYSNNRNSPPSTNARASRSDRWSNSLTRRMTSWRREPADTRNRLGSYSAMTPKQPRGQ